MTHVVIKDVRVRFGSLSVFDGLDLDVERGEFVVLLGPSGCGKSTLLNAVAGLLDVADGSISIGGRDVTWAEPKDRNIAMVFQNYALYPRMTVRENMGYGLKIAKHPRAEIERRVSNAAAILQIDHLLDRRPDQLSGGQRQRVAIGRAIVRDAGLFLFDEPLSNLDAQLRSELRLEIKRLHKRLAATMMYVTHDQVEAMTLADRVVVLKDQRIQQIGTPSEIYHRPANHFVASFVGSPRMNFLEGTITGSPGNYAVMLGEDRVPVEGYRFETSPAEGTRVTLGVRPEDVSLDAGEGIGDFTVDLVEELGPDTLVWCTDGRNSVAAKLANGVSPEVGRPARLGFGASNLSLFSAETGSRL